LVTGAALDDGASQPKDLRALVEWSLANPSYRLGFPRVLEARFIADTLSEQIRTLRIFGTIGILLYAAFSVTDRAVIPDIWPQAVVVRCCILAVSVISFAVTLRPSLNALARDVIVGLLLLLSMAGLMLLFTLTESVNKACFFDGTLLVLAFGTVCLPMRFSVTTASTLACVVLVGVCVLSSTMMLPVRYSDTSLIVTQAALMLLMNYRVKYQQRRAYLLSLRETLRHAAMAATHEHLKMLSERDGLTNLLNRRTIDAKLSTTLAECMAAAQPLGVLMIDIDNFKGYNDRYGHQAGDSCLRLVAHILSEHLGVGNECVGRFGGEEFLVIFPCQDRLACRAIAERLLWDIHQAGIPHEDGVSSAKVVTVSIGAACAEAGAADTPESLLRRADERLYAAKRSGRNRVVWDVMPTPDIATAA
jgi:diguanylate cyclase (GGDEF)-like protein